MQTNLVMDWAPNLCGGLYSRMVVWPNGGSIVEDCVEDCAKIIKSHFELTELPRVVGLVTTAPGQGGPGGRVDLAFLIHNDDIDRFLKKLRTWVHEPPIWWDDIFDDDEEKLDPIFPDALKAAYH